MKLEHNMMMIVLSAIFIAFCATDHVLVASRRPLDIQFLLASFPAPGCVLRGNEIASVLALALAIHLGW